MESRLLELSMCESHYLPLRPTALHAPLALDCRPSCEVFCLNTSLGKRIKALETEPIVRMDFKQRKLL